MHTHSFTFPPRLIGFPGNPYIYLSLFLSFVCSCFISFYSFSLSYLSLSIRMLVYLSMVHIPPASFSIKSSQTCFFLKRTVFPSLSLKHTLSHLNPHTRSLTFTHTLLHLYLCLSLFTYIRSLFFPLSLSQKSLSPWSALFSKFYHSRNLEF